MAQHRIGIDLGGTKIEIGVIGPDGSLVLRRRTATPEAYPAKLTAITNLVRNAERELAVTASVGIGIPGVISPATGLVKNANSTALNGHRLDADVAALLGRDVRVENDANCFALSEPADGAGAGHRVVFGVILLSTSPLVAGAKDESGKGDKLVRQSQTSSSADPLESPA